MPQQTLDKKEAIRSIVHASVESFAVGFQGRHEGELEDPEGTLNMKIHNVFIAVLDPEIQYYTALVRSLDSSLGNMLEKLAINTTIQAGLHYTTISKPYQAGPFQRIDILDNKGVGIGHISYKAEGDVLKLDMIKIDDTTFRNKGQAAKALGQVMKQTRTVKIDTMKSMTFQGREFLKSFNPPYLNP